MDDDELKVWFCREILPLEPDLTRFLRTHWRSQDDIADIRQEVYEKILIAASGEPPRNAAHYLFAIARNQMINRARRASLVSFDLMADLENISSAIERLTPERHVSAREELRRVQDGFEQLPKRCREVLRLRKVDGLTTKEVASALGIGLDTVEKQTTLGMRALIDFMMGGSGRVRRAPIKSRKSSGESL
jgi:RNA polymerase sigma-70 factor (ECF subfamily)